MTEDQARQRWCPFARIRILDASVNRSNDTPTHAPEATLCFASACMAWRWEDREDNDGYCGLVGEPDDE